jgi:hypothetical protein
MRMRNINSQLGIPLSLAPRNSNIRSWYARGMNDYQVQLGTEDPALDYHNDGQALAAYYNAGGWDSDNIETDMDIVLGEGRDDYPSDEFSNFVYPACIKLECKTCKAKCKNEQGLKWRQGGKECFQTCKADELNKQMDRIRALETGQNPNLTQPVNNVPATNARAGQNAQGQGVNTGTVVAIAVGVLLLGVGAALILRKRKA